MMMSTRLAPLSEEPMINENEDEEELSKKGRKKWKKWIKNNLLLLSQQSLFLLLFNKKSEDDIKILLSVLGCPLLPVSSSSPPVIQALSLPHQVSSSAEYIIQHFTAATGCRKLEGSVKNMYVTGKVSMAMVDELGSASGATTRQLPTRGCFVIWQMVPKKWQIELVVGRHKVVAGSDGNVAWRRTPWLGSHTAKGGVRPLRRSLQGVVDVRDFGAVGDGKTDNTNAFQDAWEDICQSGGTVSIVGGTYLLKTIQFPGPCNGQVGLMVNAIIQAPKGRSTAHYWINFNDINGLTIKGNGTFDGQGASAWPYNDCRHAASCSPLSASLVLTKVRQSLVKNITLLNSKGVQMKIEECDNLTINNITITAPVDSPNTDGIHTRNISYVNILDSNIGTGDDCISIGPGATNINITGINCGPGHGISIGSIGKYPSDQNVEGVKVPKCKMSSTENGVRIKTWTSSIQVFVADVTFQDIVMENAQNPIIIDQDYCGGRHDCNGNSHVQVKDVKFINVEGTSSSEIAVNLNCSSIKPCYGIELNDINLSLEDGGRATSSCSNADISYIGPQNPAPCQNALSPVYI